MKLLIVKNRASNLFLLISPNFRCHFICTSSRQGSLLNLGLPTWIWIFPNVVAVVYLCGSNHPPSFPLSHKWLRHVGVSRHHLPNSLHTSLVLVSYILINSSVCLSLLWNNQPHKLFGAVQPVCPPLTPPYRDYERQLVTCHCVSQTATLQ